MTGNVTSIVCAGCGFVVSPDEPYPFRCPNAKPGDDIDHVLVRELDPSHVGSLRVTRPTRTFGIASCSMGTTSAWVTG